MPRHGFLALAFLLGVVAAAPAQPVTRADLKPGLVFTTADAGSPTPAVVRLEPCVALCLAPGEAAHPRSRGGEAFSWQGYVQVITPGKYKFDAVLLGRLTVTVGDKTVFSGEAAGNDPKAAKRIEGAELDLPAGIQAFRADLTRTGSAVRAEVYWKGPGFQPEPVPYFFFGHTLKQRLDSFAENVARDHGRFLFEELACGRCHGRNEANGVMADTFRDRTGPSLTEIGKRAYPGWIDAWLADPRKLRPHTTMPKLFADDEIGAAERYAVTAYIASLSGPAKEPRDNTGLADFVKSVANGEKLFVTAGCAACHGDKVDAAPTPKKLTGDEDDEVPAKPVDLIYGAGTADPRGYYRLGAVGSKFPVAALTQFLLNPLATNPHGRMPGMVLTPDEARDIARFLVKATDPNLPNDMPKAPEEKTPEQWATVGKELLTSKGCVNCHAVEIAGKPPVTPGRFALSKADPDAGCLAEKPVAGKVPIYNLTADQRKALAAFISTDLVAGPGSKAPAFEARVALKRFNCLNCHSRDGEGGLPDALSDIMKGLEKAENADDVKPPRLSGAGHKLRTPWLATVLTGAGRARPWMGLRMPQYGEANVGFLPHALPKLEGTVPDDAVGKVAVTNQKLADGRELAGKTANGFGCIACHDISGIPGGGTRGPDLATISQRVRLEWYGRWMHQPQRMSPGTRMPQNFIDGKSQIAGVLKGDADAQIEALWAYFALGPGLPLPVGIEPPNKTLFVPVKDRPVVMRTFLPDNVGTRPVAVGYPGGVSVAFDASACRLGYAWAGNFLDASPVWVNRGGAPAKLLGPKFWDSPAGHPWAVTDDLTPPDFASRAANPAYGHQLKDDAFYGGPRFVHFAGYTLDEKGYPSFRYTLDGPDGKPALSVVEKPNPLPVSVASGLARSFAVEVKPNKQVWLQVGDTEKVPRLASDGVPRGFAVNVGPGTEKKGIPAIGRRIILPQPDGRAAVYELDAPKSEDATSEGPAWHTIPRSGGGFTVLLRLPAPPDGAKLERTLNVWSLPKDDDQLVEGLKK